MGGMTDPESSPLHNLQAVTLPQFSGRDDASCLLMNHKEGNLEEVSGSKRIYSISAHIPQPPCGGVCGVRFLLHLEAFKSKS